MAEKTATRIAYGQALCEFGSDERIIALDADLASCTGSNVFQDRYPNRHFNIGIAEANMVGVAAGLATAGKVPVCHSFAAFSTGRCYDQIRNSVAYPKLNVKIVGSHAGVTVGEDGATHQCLEDIALMRVVPHMTVIVPCDANETREAVRAMLRHEGPCYIRTGRMPVEHITQTAPGYSFILGKGVLLKQGTQLSIIATGLMVQEALQAAKQLEANGISVRVIDIHTIKPMDTEMVLAAAKETGAIVTAEEHSVIGGLGGAVSEFLSETYPVPVVKLGMKDCFGRSGSAEQLLTCFGLNAGGIVDAAEQALQLKRI